MLKVLTAILVAIALPALGATQTAWDHVARVVVFGDLHGDYGKFHDMLSEAGLIDSRDNWAGGKTHLVQVGDVPDRAPDTRKIVELLMKLEPQARRAGGYVHALIGDHEAMNMEGDLRYTTPGEYAAFAGPDSARLRDRYYAAVVADLKAQAAAQAKARAQAQAQAQASPAQVGAKLAPAPTPPPTFDAAYRAQFDAEHPLGWVEHQAAWSTQGYIGKWVLTHSAIIRIDDTLYIHGGLGPEFAGFDYDVMNKAVITALNHQPEDPKGPHDILWNEQGPLWYRGLALNKTATEMADVEAILAHDQVKRIVIGHTKAFRQVNTRFDGKVILTDVFAHNRCVDPHAFLIKEGEALSTVYRGHKLVLGVDGAARADYLAKVASIDAKETPPPAPCGVEYAEPPGAPD